MSPQTDRVCVDVKRVTNAAHQLLHQGKCSKHTKLEWHLWDLRSARHDRRLSNTLEIIGVWEILRASIYTRVHIAKKNTKSGSWILMECKWVRKDCFPDKCRWRGFICWDVIPDSWLEFIISLNRYYKPFMCGETDWLFEIKSSTYSISV